MKWNIFLVQFHVCPVGWVFIHFGAADSAQVWKQLDGSVPLYSVAPGSVTDKMSGSKKHDLF